MGAKFEIHVLELKMSAPELVLRINRFKLHAMNLVEDLEQHRNFASRRVTVHPIEWPEGAYMGASRNWPIVTVVLKSTLQHENPPCFA